MTALFSIMLAFMNILPIPALDGGHACLRLYEMITGRKPSDKFMEYAQMVGMMLLLGLMAYALGLDFQDVQVGKAQVVNADKLMFVTVFDSSSL